MAAAATRKRKPRPAKKQQRGFEINGKFYPAGDSYTIDEAITLCEIAGVDNIIEFDLLSLADPRCMKAMVWLVLHRDDETVEPDDVGSIRFWDVDPIRPVEEQPKDGDGGPPVGSSPEPAPGEEHSES